MAKPKLKIKVSCAGIVDRATVPHAVLVAEIQTVGKPDTRTRYALLDSEVRDALSRMRRATAPVAVTNYNDYSDVCRVIDQNGRFPVLLRTHTFDSRGAIVDERDVPLSPSHWHNAETLWCRVDLLNIVLDDLRKWLELNPPAVGAIRAPSWNALVGVQALALATGQTPPDANGYLMEKHGKASAG